MSAAILSPMSYFDQLKHPFWQKKRLFILERDNFCCCICSDTETELQVHHKEYISGRLAWQYDDSNLQTLCKFCHMVAELVKKESNSCPLVGHKLQSHNMHFLWIIVSSPYQEISINTYTLHEDHIEVFKIIYTGEAPDISNLITHAKKLII